MNSNEILLIKFYTAFQNKDFRTMQECYAPDAVFRDAVFIDLSSIEVKAMWHMLSMGAKDLVLKFDSVNCSELKGSCNWIAEYTFSLKKRIVINKIRAEFEFREGKIVRHHDTFSFWKWAAQAFGLSGILLGWTSFFRKKVQAASRKRLNDFIEQHREYSVV